MNPTRALYVASTASLVIYIIAAIWYAVPWLRRVGRATALVPLLWVHAFRHVAMQVFSAQRAGFAIPDSLRDQIAYGDLIGMALSVAVILALHARARVAIPLTWLFVLATIADLLNAAIGGMNGMLERANGVTWLILVFYVPALWVTLGLVLWQLVTRRGEALDL